MQTDSSKIGSAKREAPSICILPSWRDDNRWYLPKYLRAQGVQVQIVSPCFQDRQHPGWLRRLALRLAPFYQPLLAALRCRHADVWIAWNTPAGIGAALFKRAFGWLIPLPRLWIRDFHLDLTRIDRLRYQPRVLAVRLALPTIDLFLTTSTKECDIYATRFGIARSKLLFFPEAPRSELLGRSMPTLRGDYIIAYGNSDRDFDTLVTAAAKLPCPVTIISQKTPPPATLPHNVTWVTDFLTLDDLIDRVANARCCVLPTKDYQVAAGQNAMLEAMCLGTPIIVTRNLATEEHAENRESALFFDSGSVDSLLTCIEWVLCDPEKAEIMAKNGATRTWKLLDEQPSLLLRLLRTSEHCDTCQ